ncbi:Glycosyltransferase involved in cell wall bisynthesis [Sanguibacter gelidistatuariae]|uniref:Glycosyltransferase involved in cell wall bisynthesis n=1 Tax=Sanguibacter gelidistatuariae TaxID=1814289 RepID=A0A1G6PVI3_9MICO|nr:glycosyltransferase family 2 protein [Sanguibacter gelidistatuariae]SDC84123.1 Glycosyltransferase involved in cell wall bisynthesis [Sanguibacter gelidistatuariae]
MSVLSAPKISAVLIVKDEEAVLDECLAALHWADEIVVYDTGSSDATREIAAKYTDVVVEGYWDDDFGAARNRALDHATHVWVLNVDADEVFVGPPEAIRSALRSGVTSRSILVESVDENAGASGTVSIIRLFRKDLYCFAGRLHEQAVQRPGATAPLSPRPLHHVKLLHSGYEAARIIERGKGERNLDLARRDLAESISRGDSDAAIALRKANVARSMSFGGSFDDALSFAEAAFAEGALADRDLATLAKAMCATAMLLDDNEKVERWWQRWHDSGENPVWALAWIAPWLARRGMVDELLSVLDRIPTTVVDPSGERFLKVDLAPLHVWALLMSGKHKRAVGVAIDAARKGRPSLVPGALTELFDHAGLHVSALLTEIDDSLWMTLVMQCVQDGSRSSRRFLEAMNAARPGDAAVLLAGSALAPRLSLEEAASWAIELRQQGFAEECPLVAIAGNEALDPRQRAIAGAMAVDIYGDDRALPGLGDALARVAPDDEAELIAQLDIVAPGLVSAA